MSNLCQCKWHDQCHFCKQNQCFPFN
jgi:hypothetical protein